MGIKNLLRILTIDEKKSLESYRGKKLGIDGYSWIHKAIYNNGHELVVQNELNGYLKKIGLNVEMLTQYGIKIVLVLDGDKLPSKQNTEETRENNRNLKREEANFLLQQGNLEMANKKFAEGYDVTPQLAFHTIEHLRKTKKYNIEGIVAPYEADSQLAYLSRAGYIDGVVTEDSDLLVFGAKTGLFKLNPDGYFEEVSLKNLENNKEYTFGGWTHDNFIQFCILGGGDYLKNLNKVGIKKAYDIYNNLNSRSMKQVFKYLRTHKSTAYSEEYKEQFERAYLTMKYQTVWCPIKKRLRSLNSFNGKDLIGEEDFKMITVSDFELAKMIEDFTDYGLLVKHASSTEGLSFLGPCQEHSLALKIASCEVDPISKETFKSKIKEDSFVKKAEQLLNLKMYAHNNFVEQPRSFIPKLPSQSTQKSSFDASSFFCKSQANSIDLISKLNKKTNSPFDISKIRMNDALGKRDIKFSNNQQDKPKFENLKISDNETSSQKKMQVLEQEKVASSLISPKSSHKPQQSVKMIFEQYRVDMRRSIVKPTIENFRKAYLDKLKKN